MAGATEATQPSSPTDEDGAVVATEPEALLTREELARFIWAYAPKRRALLHWIAREARQRADRRWLTSVFAQSGRLGASALYAFIALAVLLAAARFFDTGHPFLSGFIAIALGFALAAGVAGISLEIVSDVLLERLLQRRILEAPRHNAWLGFRKLQLPPDLRARLTEFRKRGDSLGAWRLIFHHAGSSGAEVRRSMAGAARWCLIGRAGPFFAALFLIGWVGLWLIVASIVFDMAADTSPDEVGLVASAMLLGSIISIPVLLSVRMIATIPERRRVRRWLLRFEKCDRCGYSLTGLRATVEARHKVIICPECGQRHGA